MTTRSVPGPLGFCVTCFLGPEDSDPSEPAVVVLDGEGLCERHAAERFQFLEDDIDDLDDELPVVFDPSGAPAQLLQNPAMDIELLASVERTIHKHAPETAEMQVRQVVVASSWQGPDGRTHTSLNYTGTLADSAELLMRGALAWGLVLRQDGQV